MKRFVPMLLLAGSIGCAYAAPIKADLSAVKPGPISVVSSDQSLNVIWSDGANHHFSFHTTRLSENTGSKWNCSKHKRKKKAAGLHDFLQCSHIQESLPGPGLVLRWVEGITFAVFGRDTYNLSYNG